MIYLLFLNHTAKKCGAALLVLVLLSACSTHRKSRISPPAASLDVPFESHRFQGDSGINIHLLTGTEIRIAPGSLVDAAGNTIRGEVELRVREFHTAQDILRSGIPLSTRQNGSDRLQSAGMIEMRAFSKNEALEVAPGKSVEVALAGYRKADGYDLWYMEGDDTWDVRGNYRADSNQVKLQAIRTLGDSLKKPRSPKEAAERTFELVGNITAIPYLKPYAGMQWQLDDSEPTEVLGIQGRVHWEEVRIQKVNSKRNTYALTFTQFDRGDQAANKGIQKTILASPLTTRSDMKKRMAIYEREVAEVERRERERQEALAKAKRESDLVHSFKADRMGIWNVDRFFKMEDCVPVFVHFDFEKSMPDEIGQIRLFALYDGDNSVMEYDPANWKSVYLQKGKPMRLIALLPNEELAIVENESIQLALQKESNEITFQTKRVKSNEFLKTTTP